MIPQHATPGAQTSAYHNLLADELERMALERRHRELTLRTNLERPSVLSSPGPVIPENLNETQSAGQLLTRGPRDADIESLEMESPMPVVHSVGGGQNAAHDSQPTRQSLEAAYDNLESAQSRRRSEDPDGRRTDFASDEFGHPDNRPEWKASPSLIPGILEFGEGAKSGLTASITFGKHKIALAQGDPEARMVDWAVKRGFEWANENPDKTVKFILNQAKKNPAYTFGRMAGSGAVGFLAGGGLGSLAQKVVFAGTKSAHRARDAGRLYKGIGTVANMSISHQSSAIETFNKLADQLRDYGTTLRQLPQETLAAIVHASGAGFDVNFDPETGAVSVEVETKDGSKSFPLDMP